MDVGVRSTTIREEASVFLKHIHLHPLAFSKWMRSVGNDTIYNSILRGWMKRTARSIFAVLVHFFLAA